MIDVFSVVGGGGGGVKPRKGGRVGYQNGILKGIYIGYRVGVG